MRTGLALITILALARAVFIGAVYLSGVLGSEAWLVLRELHAEVALAGQGVMLVAAVGLARHAMGRRLLWTVGCWWLVALGLLAVPAWTVEAPLLRVADAACQVGVVGVLVAHPDGLSILRAGGILLAGALFTVWAFWLVTGPALSSIAGVVGFTLVALAAWATWPQRRTWRAR